MREALLPPFLLAWPKASGSFRAGPCSQSAVLAFYGVRAGLRSAEGRAFFLAGLAAAALPSRNPVPISAESVEPAGGCTSCTARPAT